MRNKIKKTLSYNVKGER